MIRRWALIFLTGVLIAANGAAADEGLPKAETILDHYIEVTGGKQAYQNRKSEMATGTVDFAAQGIKGTLMRYAADPDKMPATLQKKKGEIPNLGALARYDRHSDIGDNQNSAECAAQPGDDYSEGVFGATDGDRHRH